MACKSIASFVQHLDSPLHVCFLCNTSHLLHLDAHHSSLGIVGLAGPPEWQGLRQGWVEGRKEGNLFILSRSTKLMIPSTDTMSVMP